MDANQYRQDKSVSAPCPHGICEIAYRNVGFADTGHIFVLTGKLTEVTEVPAPPVSKELKKRWSYFIQKVYETDPLVCPKCSGEMKIISFIDRGAVIKKILQHLGLWEESHAPPDRGPPEKQITFDPSYIQLI